MAKLPQYICMKVRVEDGLTVCLDPVEPEEVAAHVRSVPKGQWVSFDAESEKCSHCKRRYYISALFAVGGNNEPDFCPGCGAYMGGDACAE